MPQPLYSTKPNLKRVLIPDTLKTLILCLVFYFAIKINIDLFVKYRLIKFLVPDLVYTVIAVVLVLLFIIQILNNYRKHGLAHYVFYPAYLEFGGKKVQYLQYNQIPNIVLKHNFIDKIFKTGTIFISKQFKIESVKNAEQIKDYLSKLITASRGGYAQYSQTNQRQTQTTQRRY